MLVSVWDRFQRFMYTALIQRRKSARPASGTGFNNLLRLGRVVPTHVLHVSLTGDFWQEIEQARGGKGLSLFKNRLSR